MLPLFTTQIFHYYYYYYYFCTEPRLPLQERVKSVFHAKEFGKIINFKTPEIAKVSLQFGLKLIFPFSWDTRLVKIISSNFGSLFIFSGFSPNWRMQERVYPSTDSEDREMLNTRALCVPVPFFLYCMLPKIFLPTVALEIEFNFHFWM